MRCVAMLCLSLLTAAFTDAGHYDEPGERMEVNAFFQVPGGRTNPYLKLIECEVERAARLSAPAGFPVSTYADTARQLHVLTWVLYCSDSRYSGEKRVYDDVVAAFQTALSWFDEKGNLAGAGPECVGANNFLLFPLLESYSLLQADLPAETKRRWLPMLKKAIDFQHDFIRRAMDSPGWTGDWYHWAHGAGYPNQDAQAMVIFAHGHRLFEEVRYKNLALRLAERMERIMYPMGAWPYVGNDLDCPDYHNMVIYCLARYLQLTGEEVTRTIFRMTADYYPCSCEPAGVFEYFTSPFNKKYWTVQPSSGPQIVAGLTRDGRNKALAERMLRRELSRKHFDYSHLYAAHFSDDSVRREALPDNYVIHDRNIEGFRGRFGKFSWVGLVRERDTLIGCMVAKQAALGLPDWCAMNYVGFRVQRRRSPGPDDQYYAYTDRGKAKCETATWLGLSLNDFSDSGLCSMVIGRNFGAIGTTYFSCHPNSSFSRWRGTQLWLLTSERLLGFVGAECREEKSDVTVVGKVGFMGPEGKVKGGIYTIGSLKAKVLRHSYGTVEPRSSAIVFVEPKAEGGIPPGICLLKLRGVDSPHKFWDEFKYDIQIVKSKAGYCFWARAYGGEVEDSGDDYVTNPYVRIVDDKGGEVCKLIIYSGKVGPPSWLSPQTPGPVESCTVLKKLPDRFRILVGFDFYRDGTHPPGGGPAEVEATKAAIELSRIDKEAPAGPTLEEIGTGFKPVEITGQDSPQVLYDEYLHDIKLTKEANRYKLWSKVYGGEIERPAAGAEEWWKRADDWVTRPYVRIADKYGVDVVRLVVYDGVVGNTKWWFGSDVEAPVENSITFDNLPKRFRTYVGFERYFDGAHPCGFKPPGGGPFEVEVPGAYGEPKYQRGDALYYAVEVFPRWAMAAREFRLVLDVPLRFMVNDGKARYLVAYNDSDRSQELRLNSTSRWKVYRSVSGKADEVVSPTDGKIVLSLSPGSVAALEGFGQ